MSADLAGPCGSALNAVLGPLPARWYCVSADGIATLCKDEEDARANARHCDLAWPKGAPHRAVLLGDVDAERERCARVCDDEARARTEAGNTHPEDSDSRGRCFAAARAAMNCAAGIRGGEVV